MILQEAVIKERLACVAVPYCFVPLSAFQTQVTSTFDRLGKCAAEKEDGVELFGWRPLLLRLMYDPMTSLARVTLKSFKEVRVMSVSCLLRMKALVMATSTRNHQTYL